MRMRTRRVPFWQTSPWQSLVSRVLSRRRIYSHWKQYASPLVTKASFESSLLQKVIVSARILLSDPSPPRRLSSFLARPPEFDLQLFGCLCSWLSPRFYAVPCIFLRAIGTNSLLLALSTPLAVGSFALSTPLAVGSSRFLLTHHNPH